MDLVSVIIPTWNRGALLVRAVRSVFLQSYPHVEVCVCDDGSTDTSIQTLRSAFVEEIKLGKLKIITSVICSGGPATPRNLGIAASKGSWVAFLDSDDWWEPEKLEAQLEFAKVYDGHAVTTNATRRDPSGNPISPFFGPQSKVPEVLTWRTLWRTNYVICSSILIRRSAMSGIRFSEKPELRAIEDYLFWISLAARTKVHYLSLPLVNYTDCPEQSIRGRERLTVGQVRRRVMREFLLEQRGLKHQLRWRLQHFLMLTVGGILR